jgi:hypothetical protein
MYASKSYLVLILCFFFFANPALAGKANLKPKVVRPKLGATITEEQRSLLDFLIRDEYGGRYLPDLEGDISAGSTAKTEYAYLVFKNMKRAIVLEDLQVLGITVLAGYLDMQVGIEYQVY